MDKKKKAQLEQMFTWIIALVVCFIIFLFFMLWNKPWQAVDNAISPKVPTYCSGGHCATDVIDHARRNQWQIPIIMMFGTMFIAILVSLKKDPNYPMQ